MLLRRPVINARDTKTVKKKDGEGQGQTKKQAED